MNNVTEEEFKVRQAKLAKQRQCPTCGAARERQMMMGRFEDELLRYLREHQVIERRSCIHCVEKHVGRAKILMFEMLDKYPSPGPSADAFGVSSSPSVARTDPNANIDVYRNFIEIVGHLGCAYDESQAYPAIHAELLAAERAWRYEGLIPDFDQLEKLMLAEKQKDEG